MSKLEDKLAASIKTGRDAPSTAKPAAKRPTRAKATGPKAIADKASVPTPEKQAATVSGKAGSSLAAREATPEGSRPMHPRRVWPD